MIDKIIEYLTIFVLIFFVFDILVRGSKVLIDGKDITIFPFLLDKHISRILKREYSPNKRAQRIFIFWGVFFSGVIVTFLMSIGLVLLLGVNWQL